MKRNFLLLSILIGCQSLMAQDSAYVVKYDTLIRNQKLKVEVVHPDHSHSNGWLQKVSDSSILVSTSSVRYNSPTGMETATDIALHNIEAIKLRKKGQVGRGFLWGAVIGAGVGGVLAMLDNSDQQSGEPIFNQETQNSMKAGAVVVTTVAGSLIGGMIAALTSRKFTIKGRHEKLNELKQKLNSQSFDLVPVYKIK
jgi:hypothetical protein